MAKGAKVELFFFSFQVYDPGLFKSHCQGDKEEEKKKKTKHQDAPAEN